MRVYRRRIVSVHIFPRSLTVCEGISTNCWNTLKKKMFPHCMWGYIERIYPLFFLFWVPSLYVRVYRKNKGGFLLSPCSLTVCEGISGWIIILISNRVFPHCMWGYIENILQAVNTGRVPSLYVRVYRTPVSYIIAPACSLTVCEGISNVRGLQGERS